MVSPPSSQPRLRYNRQRAEITICREPLSDDVSLVLVQIPGGEFLMGSPEDEPERLEREGPQHLVTVPGFWMGQYPVTQAEWRIVAGLPNVNRDLKPDPSHFTGDRLPVECVSWYDAVEFCARLTAHTGRHYRLPSEAEWEYACRAGTTTPFHFGETITTELANYCGEDRTIEGTEYSGSYGKGPKGSYREKTTPVDHFGIANAFGLCDMHGNVLEWCLDYWHDDYDGAPTDGSAWTEGGKGDRRVVRGGSWFYDPWAGRSAYRNRNSLDFEYYDVGFRVVVAPQ